jgi:uncharacterized lipoprotein YddW (UPF0748 family)
MMRRRALLQVLPLLAGGCAVLPTPVPPSVPAAPGPLQPPPAPREFRAAWVATVDNIDWPSRPGLSPDAQRDEALAILERAQAIGLNAIVLQVRPAADAIYPSALEPWSEYLTGAQGRAPQPAWDPLAFWVAQAHRRGLELHAWFNPYRARHSSAKTPLVAPHIAVVHPELVRRYGNQVWIDPGEPAAAAHTLAVVADVLSRYDIDGVQIDDYFYPYPEGDLPFPDDASWQRYHGPLARDDWRRDNVNRLVAALNDEVHRVKPGARFGVSPFGLGRPALRPPGVVGFSQYDKLYADVELWWASGWVDYLAPQLYWPIASPGQAFGALLEHWIGTNIHQRHLWPGLFTSAVASPPRNWPAREILDQIALLRARAGAGGHLHFSMVALMQDRDGIATRLRAGLYAQAALVPASPWLGTGAPPAAPVLRRDDALLVIEPGAGPPPFVWALWQRRGAEWRFSVQPANDRAVVARADAVSVAGVDRFGNLGAATALALK